MAHLARLATEVVNRIDSGLDTSEPIASFNALAARSYDASDFDAAVGSMPMEEFARQAQTPDPPFLGDITRQEYLEILRRVMDGETPPRDHEYGYWLELLRRNLGLPSTHEFLEEPTPDQALQKALDYKPIAL